MNRCRATLTELAECCGGAIRTGPFGSQLHKSDYVDKDYAIPVVMPKNMIDGRINVSSIAKVGDEVRDRLSQHILRSGDIVLARRGDIGRRAWVGDAESGWLCGTGSMRISIASCPRIRARYLYYYLATDAAVGWLDGHSVGATMSNLSAGVVGQLPIEFPDVADQDVVIWLLDSIAMQIENNQRRITILEEAGRLIYREWFVNFRFPGHGFEPVHSELGQLPAGWQQVTLGDAASWMSGGTPSTTNPDYWNGDIPWITSGSLTSFLLDDSERKLTPLGAKHGSRVVGRDATIFVVRGMSLAKEFRHGLTDREVAFGQDCKALVAKDGIYPLYLALSISSIAAKIQRMVEYAAHGTGKLSTDRLQAIVIPRPPEAVQKKFDDVVGPMRELMSNLRHQIRVLEETRNLLLPRIFSSEFDLADLDLSLEPMGE